MRNIKLTSTMLMVTFVLIVAAAGAQATTLRAFVSSTGNDANAGANCPQATPCRTFAGAFPTVTAGGELVALDTAGYGPLSNINKAITIAAVPGSTAFVVAATGTAAFTVNGGASDLIILRNLSFNGSNAASTTGVQHNSGKLEIYDCKFQQLTIGLAVTNAKADVVDSNFSGNGTGINCNGAGTNTNNNPISVALVRVNGGNMANNGFAVFSVNPGQGLNNIWFKGIGANNADIVTNIVGNTTIYDCSGTGAPCFTAGVYSMFQPPK